MLLWLLYLIQYNNNDDLINAIYQMFLSKVTYSSACVHFHMGGPSGNPTQKCGESKNRDREKRKRDTFGGWIFLLLSVSPCCTSSVTVWHQASTSSLGTTRSDRSHTPFNGPSASACWNTCPLCVLVSSVSVCSSLLFESGWVSGVRSRSEGRTGIRAGVCGTISTGWALYVCSLSLVHCRIFVFLFPWASFSSLLHLSIWGEVHLGKDQESASHS